MRGTVIRRLLREPLLHFFVVGAVLFGVYGWINGGAAERAGAKSSCRAASCRICSCSSSASGSGRPPSEELQGLIDNWVKEEIFYREGITLGLDRDDAIVRRGVGQKLEFILDSAAPPPPTDAELQAWLDTHPDDYRIEPVYSLRQVYFDPASHGDKLDAVIAAARRALAAGKRVDGDTTLLPPRPGWPVSADAQRVFGNEFAEALKTSAGRWLAGPGAIGHSACTSSS